MNSPSGVQRFWLALTVGAMVFALSYAISVRVRVAAVASGTDELAWLKREFDLSREQMDRIRKLHEGYKPRCEEMCLRFSKKNSELVQALKGATHAPPDVELKLRELAVIRAECQAEMMRHFYEVAQVMSAEQGTRYINDMCRATLQDSPHPGGSMNSAVPHGQP